MKATYVLFTTIFTVLTGQVWYITCFQKVDSSSCNALTKYTKSFDFNNSPNFEAHNVAISKMTESLSSILATKSSVLFVTSATSLSGMNILSRQDRNSKFPGIIFMDNEEGNLLFMELLFNLVLLSKDRDDFLMRFFARRLKTLPQSKPYTYLQETIDMPINSNFFTRTIAELRARNLSETLCCTYKAHISQLQAQRRICNKFEIQVDGSERNRSLMKLQPPCALNIVSPGSWLNSLTSFQNLQKVFLSVQRVQYILSSAEMQFPTSFFDMSQILYINVDLASYENVVVNLISKWRRVNPHKAAAARIANKFDTYVSKDSTNGAPVLNWSEVSELCSFGSHVCLKSCNELGEARKRKNIAVYSYNFGNYRNEIMKLLPLQNTVFRVDDYDWFFFMDSDPSRVTSNGWTACVTTPALDDEVREVVHRHASNLTFSLTRTWTLVLTKWFKFGHVPFVLRGYKYIVHADASTFSQNNNHYIVPRLDMMANLISKNSEAQLFMCVHPTRALAVQEFYVTIRTSRESAANIDHWRTFLRKDFNFSIGEVPVFSTGLFVRKLEVGSNEVTEAFSGTFISMIKFGLRRDQNVIGFEMLRHVTLPRHHAPCVFSTNGSRLTCGDLKWPVHS